MRRLIGICVLALRWRRPSRQPRPRRRPRRHHRRNDRRPRLTESDPPGHRDRRRATPASGSCRPRKSCRTRSGRVSFYRTNVDDGQGFTDISTFPVDVRASASATGPSSSAAGRSSRASTATRGRCSSRARPTKPTPAPAAASSSNYPLVREPVDRQQARRPLARRQGQPVFARPPSPSASRARAMVKLPIGDEESGASTGKTDFVFDGIVSGLSDRRRRVAATAA